MFEKFDSVKIKKDKSLSFVTSEEIYSVIAAGVDRGTNTNVIAIRCNDGLNRWVAAENFEKAFKEVAKV